MTKDLDSHDAPMFLQSGPRPNATVLMDALKARDPYTLHLMRQPMLQDFVPRYEPVMDWHIANFLEAQQRWLDEERELRTVWRK